MERCRRAIGDGRIPAPVFTDLHATVYGNAGEQFRTTAAAVGCRIEEVDSPVEIDGVIRRVYPDAEVIASALPEVRIANRNPDTVPDAAALNGTDVGVVRGVLGVAENGSVWVPQTMRERDVCFISENLVIVLPSDAIVSNMHQAYAQVKVPEDTGYGTFIAGPSKTADIAQVMVTGAQAARSVTLILVKSQ